MLCRCAFSEAGHSVTSGLAELAATLHFESGVGSAFKCSDDGESDGELAGNARLHPPRIKTDTTAGSIRAPKIGMVDKDTMGEARR